MVKQNSKEPIQKDDSASKKKTWRDILKWGSFGGSNNNNEDSNSSGEKLGKN